MFPPFPEDAAFAVCVQTVEQIRNGLVQVVRLSSRMPQPNRAVPHVTLGVLLCTAADLPASAGAVVLKTLSGVSHELRFSSPDHGDRSILVPPVVFPDKIEQALSENDAKIHELTKKIELLSQNRKNSENPRHISETEKDLRSARKVLTTQSLARVQELYSFCCSDGVYRSLAALCRCHNNGALPPTGTGECCAPKLLHYAYGHGLIPFSMAEVRVPQDLLPCQSQMPSAYAASNAEIPEKTVALFEPEKPLQAELPRCAQVPSSWAEMKSILLQMADSPRPQATPCTSGNAVAKSFAGLATLPPCDERCGIVLPGILGLHILYRDEHLVVVNKQSGLLSVPGRGPQKQDCVVNRLRRLFPLCMEQPAVHRLDMETSGLMVLAFDAATHRALSQQFACGSVHKQYIALLDGVLAQKGIAQSGTMDLFFRLDVENRPHQIWDAVHGKRAVTEWKILGVHRYTGSGKAERNATRVLFTPHTGRTHQLRLASADPHGFGVPIIGDALYGTCAEGERLMLHAEMLCFTHPVTNKRMEFHCPADF